MDSIESQTITIGFDHASQYWILWFGPQASPTGRFVFESLADLWGHVAEELESLSDE